MAEWDDSGWCFRFHGPAVGSGGASEARTAENAAGALTLPTGPGTLLLRFRDHPAGGVREGAVHEPRAILMEHAFEVLGLPEVLARVAAAASSDAGRDAVLALRPATRPDVIQRELDRVRQTARLAHSARSLSEIPDARAALRRLRARGSVLSPSELHSMGILLRAGRELARDLSRADPPLPLLASLRDRLVVERTVEERILRTVDRTGEVLDTASPELPRLRARLKRSRGTIVARLEAYVRGLPAAWVLPDASVTVREGRYVIPVRRAGRSDVGGVVHGTSSSGATLFIEPPLAIELMNRVRELQSAEAREIERVLAERTRELTPLRDALAGSQEALVEFDSLDARARTALEWEGNAPALLPPGEHALCIVRGRHPLLALRKDVEAVPFDLLMEPEERVLVVSGPNTGGKSVFLKSVGLICVLAQCGVIPPVDPGSRIPVFRRFFADIGDEQSVENDLSTFAAHLANLKDILARAGETALVLIDEMGTGTDPDEGAALSAAVLEALALRGARAVVTSHLGQLKRLDASGSGIVNGSLHFDPERAEPTYQFRKGRPGRSYGLAIARSLGFAASLIDRAEARLTKDEIRMEELLERLERMEAEAARARASLAAREAAVERSARKNAVLGSALEARERAMAGEEREARKRARAEARGILLEGRREVERAIAEVRAAGSGDGEVVARSARRRVEAAAERHRSRPLGVSPPPAPPPPSTPPPLRPGDRVRFADGDATARVVEVRPGRALVEARGGVRLEVPFQSLEPAPGSARPKARPAARPSASADPPPLDSDLRGLRVDEASARLQRILDRAVVADVPELRLIHGKGTGALRAMVAEVLAEDPRVREYRSGGVGEGGTGVTVVTLA